MERERRIFRTAREARGEARILKSEGKIEVALDAYGQAMWLAECGDAPPLHARENFLDPVAKETVLSGGVGTAGLICGSGCASGIGSGNGMDVVQGGSTNESLSRSRIGAGASVNGGVLGVDVGVETRDRVTKLESAEWIADRAAKLDRGELSRTGVVSNTVKIQIT